MLPRSFFPVFRSVLSIIGLAMAGHARGQALQVTLSSPAQNGYNISCFGLKDGSIGATVTGGTPPYRYLWSSSDTSDALSSVPSGYYKLRVVDADSASADADITLTEPIGMKVQALPFLHTSGYNVTCADCTDGSIEVTVDHGVPPYAYLWNDSVDTKDRSGLGPWKYAVRVSDANGCEARSETVYMTWPGQHAWDMSGSVGTNAAMHYIGTADSADLVLKSNGTERIRLSKSGEILLKGNLGVGLLYRMEDGTLRGGGFLPHFPPMPIGLCRPLSSFLPFWETRGNRFTDLCPDSVPQLGTLDNRGLHLITNGDERMIITKDGKVGIGTMPPLNVMNGYRLFVEDGIATRDVLVKEGAWPDYVFDVDYRLMPLAELRDFLKRQRHLPHIPAAAELEAQGGVALGDMARHLTRTVEEQALYILQLEEKLERMERSLAAQEQRLRVLETSNR